MGRLYWYKIAQTRYRMIGRCYDSSHKDYDNYGGRGIDVCVEWLKSVTAFYEWALAIGYRPGLQIDRIDNSKGYSPENCRFVTCKENNRNRRSNRRLTAFGETKTLVEWTEDDRCQISQVTLAHRLTNGWLVEDAVSKPLVYRGQRNAS